MVYLSISISKDAFNMGILDYLGGVRKPGKKDGNYYRDII
jgi:hypothetical protein